MVVALLVGTVVAGCSSEASTREDEAAGDATTTAAQVALPETIPSGTTLRVGDQLELLQTLL
jgi:uncharacterized lipoprotein